MLNDDGSTEPEISSWEAAEDGFVIRFSSEQNAFPSPIQRVPLSELYYYSRTEDSPLLIMPASKGIAASRSNWVGLRSF